MMTLLENTLSTSVIRVFYIGSKTDVESADAECINVNIGFVKPMLAYI